MCLPTRLPQFFQRIRGTQSKKTMATPLRRTTLLDLPPELRLQIYDRVLLLDLDFCIERASAFSVKSSNQSFSERWDGTCDLPINTLRQTCRLIGGEIRSFMASLPDSKKVACIELRPNTMFLYSITLRRLPCRIRQLRGLELHLRIDIPHGQPSRTLQKWVNNRVSDLSVTLLHLLMPGTGILQHARGVDEVTLWILPPVEALVARKTMRQDWAAKADEIEAKFREQLEREVEGIVNPQLGQRKLTVM